MNFQKTGASGSSRQASVVIAEPRTSSFARGRGTPSGNGAQSFRPWAKYCARFSEFLGVDKNMHGPDQVRVELEAHVQL
jgi:hypothetical protein